MQLRVRDIDLSSGGPLVAVLNEKDAHKLDLHALDRIRISKGRKSVIAVIDISESDKNAKVGEIGLFEEILDEFKVKKKDTVRIDVAKKPVSVDYIKKKLDGEKLNKKE